RLPLRTLPASSDRTVQYQEPPPSPCSVTQSNSLSELRSIVDLIQKKVCEIGSGDSRHAVLFQILASPVAPGQRTIRQLGGLDDGPFPIADADKTFGDRPVRVDISQQHLDHHPGEERRIRV